jgi:SAM-dependent methyltransferase
MANQGPTEPHPEPPPQARNRVAYDRIAPSWDAARSAFFGRERSYLDTLLADLPVPSSVLDLGCGTGRPMAEYVLACGHRLTGVDQATALLSIARERFPQARWIESAIETFRSDECHAAVICWDALFHIPRGIHREILSNAIATLRPGGRLMITVGGSEHPPFVDTMFGESFHYDSLAPKAAVALIQDLGMRTLVTEFMNEPTGGRDKGRFAIVAQKRI